MDDATVASTGSRAIFWKGIPLSTENDTRIDFLYVSEQDMIDAGVTDSAQCVEAMEETLILLAEGDYHPRGP